VRGASGCSQGPAHRKGANSLALSRPPVSVSTRRGWGRRREAKTEGVTDGRLEFLAGSRGNCPPLGKARPRSCVP
jgi:hypothetical protein